MRAMSMRVSSTQMARLLPTKHLMATQNLILFSPGDSPERFLSLYYFRKAGFTYDH